MHTRKIIFSWVVLLILSSFIAGCASPTIYSKWLGREININEKFNELKDSINQYYYDENTRINVGIGNDDSYLYVCLLTRNHGLIEQLDNAGFTVWFDPDGGKNKIFGVRLFTGIQGDGIHQDSQGLLSKDGRVARPVASESLTRKIEITGPGRKERYTTSIEEAGKYGIVVKTGELDGYFVYELKIPLNENAQHPYAIGSGKNKLIGIGFESAGFGMGMPHGGPGMGGPAGEMIRMDLGGGMGGPGGGSGSGGGPGGRMKMPGEEGLQLWLRVVLATKEEMF